MNILSMSLKLRHYPNNSNKCNKSDELIENFKYHSSILKIKENFESLDKFTFESVTIDEVRKDILNLVNSKAMQCRDIPAKMIKESIDVYLVVLTNIINLFFQN